MKRQIGKYLEYLDTYNLYILQLFQLLFNLLFNVPQAMAGIYSSVQQIQDNKAVNEIKCTIYVT